MTQNVVCNSVSRCGSLIVKVYVSIQMHGEDLYLLSTVNDSQFYLQVVIWDLL